MEHNTTLEILKQAILLEKRGKVFYAHAAENAKNQEVKDIFILMASEEDQHIKYLSEQYLHFKAMGTFDHLKFSENESSPVADQVLSKSLTAQISALSFEAIAISMALDMESRAIKVYSERAQQASDPEEKSFYQWLAAWEQGHYKILLELDQELKEKIWMDNNFWAF